MQQQLCSLCRHVEVKLDKLLFVIIAIVYRTCTPALIEKHEPVNDDDYNKNVTVVMINDCDEDLDVNDE